MSVFTGAGVAIVTPFKDDESIDYEGFAKNIEYQIANGTDAIIVCGTTGEAATMTEEEHLDVIRYCVKVVNGRIPVIAGTGSNCTKTAVYLTQEAEKAGVDAALVVTPYYNKATQAGLIKHFTAVAQSVNIPLILYNIPSRTGGVNILPETMVKLAKENKNIVGVKDATGNFSQLVKMQSLADGCIDVYSGNDDQVVPLLSLGGKGVISVLSHVAPRDTHLIVEKFLNGDTKGSLELQLKYLPMVDQLFCEVNPIPVKTACRFMGFKTGPLRSPLCEMEPAHAEALKAEMKKLGII